MAEGILTYPTDYYCENHRRKTTLMDEYRTNMLIYLKKSFPDVSDEDLIKTITSIIAEQYTPSTLSYLSSASPCNLENNKDDLLSITNAMNDDILSPYGATYCSVNERKAIFSDFIEDKQSERKSIKKEMLLANLRADKDKERMCNLGQMNVKIDINALSGVMLSNVTFRSAANYNAITGTARFGIMTAYSVVELSLASNYYFYSEDRAISWVINLLRIYQGDDSFKSCIDMYHLAIPSKEKVFSAYSEQVNLYAGLCSCNHLRDLIDSLSPLEVAFVYYAVNMKRIFQENEYFRGMFDALVDIDNIPLISGEIPKVAKLKDDLIVSFVVVSLSADIGKFTLDDLDNDHPDLARRVYSTYVFFESKFAALEILFKQLVILPIVPSDIDIHRNIIRNTVLLSDTDSILFTNISWVKWYSKNTHITDKSTRLNMAIITLVSKFLEHIFAYMSASMNIDPVNIRLTSIKNEFMYDCFLRTPISKHYAGYAKFKEGVLQNPYRFDLKGRAFRGSDLCKETTTYVKWFIKYIFDTFLKTNEIIPEDLISKTIVFEQRIRHSIIAGEVTFLKQQPINLKEEYAKPESSNWLYYDLWQNIFAEKYGDLNLPQKTKELPIEMVSLRKTSTLDKIKEINPDLHERFISFLSKYPKKEFKRIFIPMDVEVPEELRAIANYRKVCTANCRSLELVLKSLNIVNYPSKGRIVLFSDIYPQILQEITDEDRKRIIEEAENEEIIFEDDDDDDDWWGTEEDEEWSEYSSDEDSY